MAYVYCHSCGWSQDDFYDEHYNPAKSLKDWDSYLFGENKDKLDQIFSEDPEFIRENGRITARQLISKEYRKYESRLLNMKWVTWDDFNKDKNKQCPRCHSGDLGVD